MVPTLPYGNAPTASRRCAIKPLLVMTVAAVVVNVVTVARTVAARREAVTFTQDAPSVR